MRTLLFILLLIPFYCYSQETSFELPDALIEPDIYKKLYFDDQNNYIGINSMTTIVKNRYENFKDDTLQKVYYDNFGNKIKVIRFDNNLPSVTTYFDYNSDNKLKSWKSIDKFYATYTNYIFDNKNRVISIEQYKIRLNKSDSSLIIKKKIRYSEENLIEIISLTDRNIIETYNYENNILKEKEGGYISKQYYYDSIGNLIRINEYMGGEINPDKIVGIKKFSYGSDNLLVTDSILTSSNIPNSEYQITNYVYYNGEVNFINVKFKEFYRNIDFKYENGKIIQVNLTTNNSNSAYLRHWISYKIEEFYDFPIDYKELFEYDSKGNRISKKIYVNNELFSEINYLIVY